MQILRGSDLVIDQIIFICQIRDIEKGVYLKIKFQSILSWAVFAKILQEVLESSAQIHQLIEKIPRKGENFQIFTGFLIFEKCSDTGGQAADRLSQL